ncbi:type 1 glutamine amidotransferase domain-containing protein [Spirosoma sp.]|uniref:type 1 glutamine amidotransferase domain-containing protein n=1 Tax=Spirosoma sp. TaxID=1899569 RepID=UPI00260729FF|nr:type 1 glutamine amidotransferase domain-containing protein [Spirosoma sp.]MCX6217535.1 type 1 glutamine amidotransferase domain-containing protein [Spirosoma sp.]
MKEIFTAFAMTFLTATSFAQSGNQAKSNKNMRIVFVVSNQVKSETTGYPIGFWLSELAQPFYEFQEVGYEVTIASPDGGKIIFDSWSDPESPNARELDLISTGFKHHPKTVALMENTVKLDEIKAENFDGIFVVGGLGPMQTFYNNEKLHKLFAQFYQAGKASATICHGSSILLKTKLSDGKLLAEGKKWTGFCNAEEDIVDKTAKKKMQPFRIEDEAKKLNTNYVTGKNPYSSFAVADGNLISGQQGSSGAETAKLVINYLKR